MTELLSGRLPFIGRQREQDLITQAIADADQPLVLIVGDAGVGKTFLLDEARRIAQELGAVYLPVVDFYDTSMHSHQRLEATIAESLDARKEHFGEYWKERKKDPQRDLWDEFKAGYQTALGDRHAVLSFDTAERLEYERDPEEVLADCEVREQGAPSWQWLLERVGDLPNTAILIAARPTNMLRKRLADAYGNRVRIIEIKGFTRNETEAYFRATHLGRQVAEESSEMVEKIHLLSDGRPILIALAIDWLGRGMWDESLSPVSARDLRTWKTGAHAEERSGEYGEVWQQWRKTRQRFEEALVKQIRRLASPLDIAVRYVALCRKGCNAAILSRLMDISEAQAGGMIEQLLTLSFVKSPRPGSHGLFFLHDEMYDLVEEYVWKDEWPDYREQGRLDCIIVEWYNEQIRQLAQQIKDSKDYRERVDLRRQQQLQMAERLYYQFDADPREGYRAFSRLDEEAIGAREHEWDVLLRNEALWFLGHRGWRVVEWGPTRVRDSRVELSPWVHHDFSRHWVERYIVTQQWKKAVDVAEKLLAKKPLPEEPELYRPGLKIALATAQAYLGGVHIDPALKNFRQAIAEVQALVQTAPAEKQNRRRFNHLLGTAYLYQGLALRSTPYLRDAARSYLQAAYRFRENEYGPGLAEALNNLAYVYARQGKPERAMAPCDEALAIRQELGDEYPIGLSLNTKGIIYERRDLPETAIRFSEDALEIFEDIGNERGEILARINLGRAYRRKGRSSEWRDKGVPKPGKKSDFEEGEAFLSEAITQIGKDEPSTGDAAELEASKAAETFYLVEAYDELGCLYRDWVASLWEYERERALDELVPKLEKGVWNLERARDLLRDNSTVPERNALLYVDATEDLARVHYWRARVESEREAHWSQEALALLKEALRVTDESIAAESESWFLKGKVYHQYARIAEQQGQLEEAAGHYARAAGFLEKYSPYTPELRKTVSGAVKWLGSLCSKEKAEEMIKIMQDTLIQEDLLSSRLQEWIDDTVLAQVGVGWS